jgi:aspartyl protease family protein
MFGAHVQTALVAIVSAVIGVQAFVHMRQRAPQPTPPVQIAAVAPRPAPARTVAAQPRPAQGEARIGDDSLGHYFADVEINGSRLHMLVDTGASLVSLSYEDAAAIGVYPAPADYKYGASTANGTARVARATLRQVRIGSVVAYDVEASVGERGTLSTSLLGMTFLSKMSRIEVASGALVLHQ